MRTATAQLQEPAAPPPPPDPITNLGQRNKEGLHVGWQVAGRGEVAVHLPALTKLLEAVVKLAARFGGGAGKDVDDIKVSFNACGTLARVAAPSPSLTPAAAHLATITVRLKVGSTSCTTCSHKELAHSTDDCCRNTISRCEGAACCRTMRMMSSGVESASPLRACRCSCW